MATEPLLDSDVDRVTLRRVGNGWIAITEHVDILKNHRRTAEHVDILKNHRRTVELVASTPAELASLVQQWAAAQTPEKRDAAPNIAEAVRKMEAEN
jgi:hypothetical protein